MADREKTISTLETALRHYEVYSGDEYGRVYEYANVDVSAVRDALELLKAQEPVKPMDDLISRVAVLNGISDLMKSPWYNDGKDGERHIQYLARKDAVEIVKMLCVVKEPAVDAVPVVRCKDCKWFDCKNYVCNSDIMTRRIADCGCYPNFNVDSDWFCADGERRDKDATD